MREVVALLVLYIASRLIDLEAKEADFLSGLALLVCLGALIFLAAAIAERLNPKIKQWHRITPGIPTELDETEWRKIGAAPETPRDDSRAPPPPAARRRQPQPAQKTEPVFYDSGFDNTAGLDNSAAKQTQSGPDNFDEIFGAEKDEPPR